MSGFCHEASTSQSVQWYTPKWIFELLGLRFRMDIAAPSGFVLPWVPAELFATEAGVTDRSGAFVANGDGLTAELEGLLWCNPPFGPNVHKWIDRMAKAADGVLLLPSRTDPVWFHEHLVTADSLLFTNGRVAFAGRDGSTAGPGGVGTMLAAYGEESVEALERFAAAERNGKKAGEVYYPGRKRQN